MKLTKTQRSELRMRFGGKCAYCGCVLHETKWHADHVKAVERKLFYDRAKRKMLPTGELYCPENDCLDNLMPSCPPCNIDKGSMPLDSWREYLSERIVEGLRRNSSTFRHAERFGRVTITPGPLVFWFERYADDQIMELSA